MARYRSNVDGTAVCAHRDLSVCADCAIDPELVEVAGAHFHLPDPADRAADLAPTPYEQGVAAYEAGAMRLLPVTDFCDADAPGLTLDVAASRDWYRGWDAANLSA